MSSETVEKVAPDMQVGEGVEERIVPARRRRKPRLEETYRSIDAPWLGEEILLGLSFWTVEEFAQHAKVTTDQVQAWIDDGLPTLKLPDGGIRISEAAADEWARHLARQSLEMPPFVPEKPVEVESPYLTAKEAAAYLRLRSVKALYGLVERGKLKPLPGHRHLRFTRQQLDTFMEGRKK